MVECIVIDQSPALQGAVDVSGAKNAVLVIMASLILTTGKSLLSNVPWSADVEHMALLLRTLGAQVEFNRLDQSLEIDTTHLNRYTINPESMRKMRASILLMGPLLARFGLAEVAIPGGCVIGQRPIDFHLKSFARMGVELDVQGDFIKATARQLKPAHIVLEYPSVGCTENILMAASLTRGLTRIVNAALEPEVLDLISVLRRMGASIEIKAPATIEIEGIDELQAVKHTIMPDRLEAGSLLVAAAITGGTITVRHVWAQTLEVFLEKLSEMGHTISTGLHGKDITLKATPTPKAVSFRTMPYPGFPTDLQAPLLAAQCVAEGVSSIQETVYENRLLHTRELQKMGAHITLEGQTAIVKGVEMLYGTRVIATDIRASAALIVAGLKAQGQTIMAGIHHLKRGYQDIEHKLSFLGARLGYASYDNSLLESKPVPYTTENRSKPADANL